MPTITPTKTVQTDLVTWQDIATANVVLSSAFDVSTKRAGAFGVFLARRSGTALTSPVNVRLEGAVAASGDQWIPICAPYAMALGASIANTTLNGAVSAGATSIVVAAATNIAAGDILFLRGNSDAQNELCRVKAVSGTTVTLEEGVLFAKNTGNAVTDQAEMVFPALDLTPYVRVRAVVENLSGQSVAARVSLVTYDSDTSA